MYNAMHETQNHKANMIKYPVPPPHLNHTVSCVSKRVRGTSTRQNQMYIQKGWSNTTQGELGMVLVA